MKYGEKSNRMCGRFSITMKIIWQKCGREPFLSSYVREETGIAGGGYRPYVDRGLLEILGRAEHLNTRIWRIPINIQNKLAIMYGPADENAETSCRQHKEETIRSRIENVNSTVKRHDRRKSAERDAVNIDTLKNMFAGVEFTFTDISEVGISDRTFLKRMYKSGTVEHAGYKPREYGGLQNVWRLSNAASQ